MREAKPVIVGCQSTVLTTQEEALFGAQQPVGLILFARNIADPDQVRALIDQFRRAVRHDDALVLIDQEGGAVRRLTPPYWAATPAMKVFGDIATGHFIRGAAALKLNCALMACQLRELGINVNCVPVLDVPQADADPVIGDRAFSTDPELVAKLGRSAVDSLMENGVLPVIKHIPGHGRATADSHMALPRVAASRNELETVDFVPFRALHNSPFAMTAHIVYEAIDDEHPATLSAKVIEQIIRGAIGFEGILMSDDICMKALSGTMAERATSALDAGCDLVLHCSGDFGEAEAVLSACPAMGAALAEEIDHALDQVAAAPMPNMALIEARFAGLMAG